MLVLLFIWALAGHQTQDLCEQLSSLLCYVTCRQTHRKHRKVYIPTRRLGFTWMGFKEGKEGRMKLEKATAHAVVPKHW